MRKFLRKVFTKIYTLSIKIARKIYKSPNEKRTLSWFNDKGDQTLRLNYDLTEKSIVFDIGGYLGKWSSNIFTRYCCTIYIFEPVLEYAEEIQKRFIKNKKVKVNDFGLADNNSKVKISVDKDASSIYTNSEISQEIRLVKASDFIKSNEIKKIDLMKINIEGGEYDLLNHLIDTNLINIITNLQIQFHDFVENADEKMKEIQDKLEKSHYLTYQYPFVWENWKIKNELK